MFYEPGKDNHNLSENPFKSIVVPRPIGWISSIDEEAVINLAPYSYFNAVCDRPPIVMFSSGSTYQRDGKKDTLRNIETTHEFVCNIATWDLRNEMNNTSASLDPKINELEVAGLNPKPSKLVKPPCVAEAPIHLECKYIRSVALSSSKQIGGAVVVFGEVVGVNIDDELITTDGLIDIHRLNPIGRLGYKDYVEIDQRNVFSMDRPD